MRQRTSRWVVGSMLVGLVACVLPAAAGTITSQASGNWGAAGTWAGGVPGTHDDVFIASGHTVTMTGLPVVAINSLSVSGVLTHATNATVYSHRANLLIAADLVVAAGGAIDVTAAGYMKGYGPGATAGGTAGRRSGGSHGGKGAQSTNGTRTDPGETYGSIIAPTNLGSGGAGYDGSGSLTTSGGGAVLLTVGGVTRVYGLIAANGTNGFGTAGSGGSGGSIYLTTSNLIGTGTLQANGGPAVSDTGSGGGGRVAVVLTGSTNFDAVVLQAFGGTAASTALTGGGGSVYTRTRDQGANEGILLVANNGKDGNRKTEITTNVTDTSVGTVIIRDSATLILGTNQALTVNGSFSNGFTYVAYSGSTLKFAGTNTATIYGSQTNASLVCTNAGKTLLFQAGRTNTVNEALTLTGNGTARLVLRSTAGGTYWNLSAKATAVQAVDYVDVQDSNAKAGYATAISATHSVDSGNNTNWLFVASGVTNTWIGASNTVWTQAGNWDLGRIPIGGDTSVVISNGCAFYPVLDIDRDLPGLIMRNGSTFALNNHSLNILGDATLGGTLVATGTETVTFLGSANFTGGAFTPAQSTVVIGGSSTQVVTSAGQGFFNLTVTNTATPVAFADAVRAAHYRSQSASVTYGGGVAAGSLAVYSDNGAVTQTFTVGTTVTADELYLLGTPGKTQVLRSSGPGTWSLDVSNVAYVKYVDVQNSDASAGRTIYAQSSTDSGGNSHWVFDAPWKVWTGSAGTAFTNDANWTPSGVPTATNFVLIDDPHPVQIATTVTVYRLVLGGSAQSRLTANAAVTVQEDLQVLASGLLTHGSNSTAEINKLNVMVGSNLTVAAGGLIGADGCGYDGASGPGKPVYDAGDTQIKRSGGSYGGRGGQGAQNIPGVTYGSIIAPTNLGSGGASFGVCSGGGAMRLIAGGTTRVDGIISAGGTNDGANANAGGAGGSVYLTTASLAGTGAIRANGGRGINDGYGCGAGGGGRVAVVLTGSSSFGAVTVQALGGVNGGLSGAAGTVYTRTASQGPNDGVLVVANNGVDAVYTTEISSNVTDAAVGDVVIRNGGEVRLNTNRALVVYGSFSNGVAFMADPGTTVTLAGTNAATIYGASTFQTFVCTNAGKTLAFQAGVTNTAIQGLTLKGSAGAKLMLRSSVDGASWYLSVPESAAQHVNDVNVKDSHADAGYATAITAVDSTDSGNNVNWSFATAGVIDTWIGVADTSWANPANWDQGRPPLAGDQTAVISNGCAFYPALLVAQTVPGLVLLSGSTLSLNGQNLTVTGDAAIAGTLSASGTETVLLLGNADFTGGVFAKAQTTIVLGGSNAQSVVSAGVRFASLVVSNTAGLVTFADALAVDHYRSVGRLLAYTAGVAAGDFEVDSVAGGVTQSFAGGTTVAVSNLYLLGTSSTQVLQSTGGPWHLAVSGVANVRHVIVSDSDASGGRTVFAQESADAGGNPNWVFDASWKTWTGAVDTNYFNAANWSPTGVPTAASYVLIDAPVLAVQGLTTAVYRLVIGGSTSATLRANALLTVNEELQILAGGVLTHATNTTSEAYKLSVAVASNLTVALGGRISADSVGYQGDAGVSPGVDYGGGGTHGGQGGHGRDSGQVPGPTYGSIVAPTNCGSGGAINGSASGYGGGAMKLAVGGTARLDGSVTANGRSMSVAWSGGGAGGSVWLTAAALAGGGTITANGGNATYIGGDVSGGGGGRIAVVLTGSAGFADVGFQARGGVGVNYSGAAGTVYLEGNDVTAGHGRLVVDNNGVSTTAGEATDMNGMAAVSLAPSQLILRNGAMLGIGSNDVLTLTNAVLAGEGSAVPAIRLNAGQLGLPPVFAYSNLTLIVDATGTMMSPGTGLTVNAGGTLEINATHAITGNVTLATGSTMRHKRNSTAELYKIDLAVQGNFTVASGSVINVDGRGYTLGNGPGTSFDYRSGGSYGGRGAKGSQGYSTNTYGSTLAPTNCGSGGGGGGAYGDDSGGGAVLLRVSGTTTIDGLVTADGTSEAVAGNSGGSGGSVYLITGGLAGAGTIHANGGAAYSLNGASGAGGGGRVSVNLTAAESFGNVALQARGGLNGSASGGAGTVYRATASQAGGRGTVTINNEGMTLNGFTELPAQLSPGLSNELEHATLVVTNTNTKLVATTSATVGDVLVYTNTTLVLGGSTLTVKTAEHWLDDAGRRGAGNTNRVDHYNQILWATLRGIIFSIQ